MKPDQNPEQNPEQTSFPGSSIHPVEELQRKGIRKLRVIPESQLKKTAREAVAHALLELLDGLEIDEPVRQELRIRANQLLGNPPQVAPCPAPEPASGPRQITSAPLVIPSFQNVPTDVSIEQGNGNEEAAGNPLGKREKALLLQLSRLISQDWRSELATVRDSHRDQVDRLEVRIQELTQALQATDQVLETSSQQNQANQEVNTPFDHKKSELLDQLFQANVALRALSQGPSKGVSPSRDGEGR